jgi:hypothetical protein
VYCAQSAIAVEEAPAAFAIRDNFLFGNREPGGAAGAADLTEMEFRERAAHLLRLLAERPALARSRVLSATSLPPPSR